MAERKFVLGIDYGTESARALLVDVADGTEVATAVYLYSNGVITDRLPGAGTKLPAHDWALQDPEDYLRAPGRFSPISLRRAAVAHVQIG